MSVEDRLDILEAIAVYSHLIDGGDADGWVDLFTEDAVWESRAPGADAPSLRYEGRAELRQFAQALTARGKAAQSRHNRVNTVFDELTGDRARTRSNALITAQLPEGEPRVALTGVYEETWRKVDGRWRLANLVLHTDRPVRR